MANNVDTKLQANFKMANGDLINVYAVDQADFEAQLTAVQDTVELIKSVSNSLMGRSSAPAAPVDPWTIKEAVGTVADTLGGGLSLAVSMVIWSLKLAYQKPVSLTNAGHALAKTVKTSALLLG